jgi:hypothetical protein
MKQDGYKLVNCDDGGKGCPGYTPTLAQRRAASKRLKNRKLSQEWKDKIAVSHLGLKASAEAIANMRKSHLGKKQSASAVDKTASAHIGMKRSEATKAKQRAAWEIRRVRLCGLG